MSKSNSYGSKTNKARRKAVADKNAQAEQEICRKCGGQHRKGRHYR